MLPEDGRHRLSDATKWTSSLTRRYPKASQSHKAIDDARKTLFVWNALKDYLSERDFNKAKRHELPEKWGQGRMDRPSRCRHINSNSIGNYFRLAKALNQELKRRKVLAKAKCQLILISPKFGSESGVRYGPSELEG